MLRVQQEPLTGAGGLKADGLVVGPRGAEKIEIAIAPQAPQQIGILRRIVPAALPLLAENRHRVLPLVRLLERPRRVVEADHLGVDLVVGHRLVDLERCCNGLLKVGLKRDCSFAFDVTKVGPARPRLQ